MHRRQGVRGFGWRARVVALCLILALAPGCQGSAAQIYIPLGYGLTGLCIALLMSPTPLAVWWDSWRGCCWGPQSTITPSKRQLSASPGKGPPNDQ